MSSDLKQSIICGGQNERGLDIAGCHRLSPLDGWKFQEVIGSADTAPRSDHTALIYESNMSEVLILYGGISTLNQTTGKVVDDNNGCEVFSTTSYSKVDQADCDVDNAPVARFAHSASLIGTLWLIFGGFTSNGVVISDGVQALDFLNFPKLSWVKQTGIQLPVPPRAYHASASFSNSTGSYLIISGGQGDQTGQILYRDIWIFGPVPSLGRLLSKGRWSSPIMADSAPIIYGHRIVIVGARLYAFGGANPPPSGVYSLDTNEFTIGTEISWSALPATGSSPQAMFRSSITSIDADGSADLELLVFGGSTVGPNPTFSGTLSVLTSAEGGNSAMRVNLPAILGGSTVAVFFIGAVLWFLLRNSNKSRMIRMESDVFSTQQNQYSYQTAYSSKQAPLVDDESEEAEDSIKEEETLRFYAN